VTDHIEAIATKRIERLGKGPDDLKPFARRMCASRLSAWMSSRSKIPRHSTRCGRSSES
jgi:hypothetical protein